MTGCEIVEADNPLIVGKQGFQQIRADKAGNAGHQPGGGMVVEFVQPGLISLHLVCFPEVIFGVFYWILE